MNRGRALLAFAIVIAAALSARAAEIRLLSEATPAGAVVRLGDIAEVFAADNERVAVLRSAELCPAGGSDSRRTLSARQIQELLYLRGFSPTECRFSGASHVTLISAAAPKEPKTVLPAMEKRATDAVRSGIEQYTTRQRRSNEPVELEFTLSDEQVRAIDTAAYRLAIRGGSEPWLGTQQYDVVLAGGAKPLPITAEVKLPPMAVVAKRAIDRGEIFAPEDLALARLKPGADASGLFENADSVVGREATRAIGPGQTIDEGSLRQPLLVRKGDAVTVYTRAPGLQVRTTARAREDGSLGELVSIESMLNRQTFLARVSGSQEVEIYARPADTGHGRTEAQSTASDKGQTR